MTPLLFIVARNQPKIYEHLIRSLAGSECVQVLLDRRARERRQRPVVLAPDRRRSDRRARPHEPAQFYPLGYAIVQRPLRRTWLQRLTAGARA